MYRTKRLVSSVISIRVMQTKAFVSSYLNHLMGFIPTGLCCRVQLFPAMLMWWYLFFLAQSWWIIAIRFTHGNIFLFLYTLCVVLRASVFFYFQFVCVLFSGLCNKLDHCILVWERVMLHFFIKHSCSSLICVECLAFIIHAAS